MSTSGVQSIDRTLDIIELLSVNGNGLGITEISSQLNLNKSTVHRIVNALVRRGYLKKDNNMPVYKLGLKFIEISSITLGDIELKTEAKPYLYELSTKFNFTTHLGILEDLQVIYIDKVNVNTSLRLYSQIGKRIDVHSSSLGKILLSELSDEAITNLLKDYHFNNHTEHTIQDIDKFLKEIEEVREKGYALDDEEHDKGIKCVSSPVRDYTGKIIAAISISGSVSSIDSNLDDVVAETIKCGKNISKSLGYGLTDK